MDLKILHFLEAFLIGALFLTLVACGSGVGPNSSSLDGDPAGVNFSLEIAGNGSSGKALSVKTLEEEEEEEVGDTDAAETVEFSDVRVNVRRVEFYLPEGVDCDNIDFAFEEPVSCEAEENHEEEEEGEPKEEEGDHEEEPEEEEGEPEEEPFEAEGDKKFGLGGDDEWDKVLIAGPFVADLILGTTTPDLTDILIPSGVYTRIDVELGEADDSDGNLESGDPLIGHTLVAHGRFTYEGQRRDLTIRLKFHEEIRFRHPDGIEISEDGANDVVVTLDASTWFDGINLSACLDLEGLILNEDGSLVIDEEAGRGECDGIENIIRENIEASARIEKEGDGEESDDSDDEENEEEEGPHEEEPKEEEGEPEEGEPEEEENPDEIF